MAIAEDIRDDAWHTLENLGGPTVGRPPRRRDASGRWQRADGGEWDWYYALADAEREYVRRFHTAADGVEPDTVATLYGFDTVDHWAQAWLEAIRATRPDSTGWAREWERGDYDSGMAPDPRSLLGPAEVASLLRVKHQTVHQWAARGILPEPWAILSGTRLWPRAVILEWAESTGRLPAQTELPVF